MEKIRLKPFMLKTFIGFVIIGIIKFLLVGIGLSDVEFNGKHVSGFTYAYPSLYLFPIAGIPTGFFMWCIYSIGNWLFSFLKK